MASGLHEILEVENPGEGKVDGVRLHHTIQENGFAEGITGNITFETSTDRHFPRTGFNVLTFQKGQFVRVGSIATGNNELFKDCEQLSKEDDTPSLSGCHGIIFRGLCGPNTHWIGVRCICIHTRILCCCCCLLTDGTSKVPDVRAWAACILRV